MSNGHEHEILRQEIVELGEKIRLVAERQNEQFTDIMMLLKEIQEKLTQVDVEAVDMDELYEDAKEFVISERVASTSVIQRALQIGYSRAATIMDRLETDGIIGPQDGSKPRVILVEG